VRVLQARVSVPLCGRGRASGVRDAHWAGDARRLCRNRGRHQNHDHSRHEQDPTHEAPTMLCLCLLWRRRYNRHKERNVCDLLPERDRPQILVRIRGAWALSDRHLARERLELLAS
jgi:hypothetical protein